MDAELLFEGDELSILKTQGIEFVHREHESVIIVATIDEDQKKKILLIEQMRPSIGRRIVELPAGKINKKESARDAALRELEEETGYRAKNAYFLTQGPSSAGMSNEIITFMLATELEKVSDGGGIGNENITVHKVDLITVNNWLEKHGEMIDPRIWAGIYARIAFLINRPQIESLQ